MSDDLRKLGEEVEAALGDGAGMDVVLRSASPEEAQAQLESTRTEMERVRRRVQATVIRQKRELERQAAQIKSEMEALQRETNAALAPIKKFMAQLGEGLHMIELFLGTKEQILTLREGEPAAETEPVSVRQLVLAMDEECAVAAEEGGIDSIEIEQFDAWLLEDPAHVHQVIPEQKGVVALVPRWRAKHYEDAWKADAAARGNKQTYFLVRNGEQLYRIWTDFNVGKRLLPTRNEYAELFWKAGFDDPEAKKMLDPGSKDWEKAQEDSDDKERHYRKVMLIFEGLLQRTTVWHPVSRSASFLDPAAHREGRVRLIMDGEADRMIGTGRRSWKEWLAEKNAQLRPGMRVIVNAWGVNGEGHSLRTGGYYNRRLHPTTLYGSSVEGALDGQLLQIEERTAAGELVVRFKRVDEIWVERGYRWTGERAGLGDYVWERGGSRLPKTRASLKIKPDDDWVLPYDLATEEELRVYLEARLDRHEYVTMFPVIKSALVAKKKEREEEEPFYVMLSGVLTRENGGTVAEAEARIPALVEWYKLANRHHRALRKDDAKAVRLIVAEDARRLKETDAPHLPALRERHPRAMLIARKRASGAYVVLEPMEDRENVYARYVEYSRGGSFRDARPWWKPEPQQVNRWQHLWTAERWEGWDLGAVVADHLTGPERDAIVQRIRAGEFRPRRGRRKRGYLLGGETDVPLGPLLSVTQAKKDHELLAWYVDPDSYQPDLEDEEDGEEETTAPVKLLGHPISWRREKGEVRVSTYEYASVYTDEMRGWGVDAEDRDKDRFESARKDALYLNEEELALLEGEELTRRARRALSAARSSEVWPYSRAIESQRRERGERRHVETFVAEYEYEELYEGHMKAHPDERYEHECLEGLDEVIREALDRGEALEGRPLGEVWPDAPEEDRGLVFPAPEEDEEEDEDDDDEWYTNEEGVVVEELEPLELDAGEAE